MTTYHITARDAGSARYPCTRFEVYPDGDITINDTDGATVIKIERDHELGRARQAVIDELRRVLLMLTSLESARKASARKALR